jgi:tryptophanyl-tRNA synthetase
LHVGHLEGALANYVRLQDEYECFYMVADWHALTTGFEETGGIRESTLRMVADWLAAGIDPEKAVIFRQSQVLQHAELFTLLSMFTPVPWLERCPTYKEQQQEMPDKDLSSFGFLGYPLLQAADILVYKAEAVPVGQDQLPHLEMAREVARRFNHLYAPVFPEPQAILAAFPKIPGTDGRKMSKSYGNSVDLDMEGKALDEAVRSMYTDPLKVRKNDLGHPEGCVVFAFHGIYNHGEAPAIEKDCRSGALGCVDCKKNMQSHLKARLEPLQQKRRSITPQICENVLQRGAEKARQTAEATMQEVRRAMKL